MTDTRRPSLAGLVPAHPREVAFGIAAAFGMGVILACQSRINGELGQRLDDGVLAALWSFGSGWVVLLILMALLPGVRRGVRQLLSTVRLPSLRGDSALDRDAGTASRPAYRLRWWQCLGGVCGAYLVVVQSTTVGLVGVAVFTVAVVAGQAATSLVVDRLGLGPAGRTLVTRNRVLGASLALGAVALAVSDEVRTPALLLLAVAPALAGVGTAWQQAVNGRVSATATVDGNGVTGALVAALINFTVGTAALGIAAGVDIILRGLPSEWPAAPQLYLGGLCGVAFITGAAFIVRFTGVLLLGLGAVAGQLVGALVLDGLIPAGDAHLTTVTLIGTLLTLVAVMIAALPTRSARP
ncbi:DMT family transporter [Actinopolymorpha sp. B9G3]|uniref:DMT family transporter n=1 Tax=Actinopolymorpha sp. B9G3 TaxID=3158970 RepID=UPI0032D99566